MRFTRWDAFLESLAEPVVFYDLETDHPQPEMAHIVEFGAAIYGPASLLPEGAEPVSEPRSLIPGLLYTYEQRVNPGPEVLKSSAFQRASKIHHITAADLEAVAFTPADLQDEATQLLGAGTVCGFNSAEYDDRVMWCHGPSHTLFEDRAHPTSVDVLRVVRAVFAANPIPEIDPHAAIMDSLDGTSRLPNAVMLGTAEHSKETLSALSVCLLGLSHKDAHGALPDCLRTAEILAALMELWPVTCPNTLAGLQALTRHPDGDVAPNLRKWDGWDRMLYREDPCEEWVFKRGKHRGCALGEVDRGYLQWMISKGDFHPDTKALIRAHLGHR